MSNISGDKICPYCQSPIKPDDDVVYCSECNLIHHAQCWQENGKCTTFGCEGYPVTTSTNKYPGVNFGLGYVDLTIDDCTCSQCGASNSINALFCSQCGNNLSEHQCTRNPIFCSRCGAKNEGTNNICSSCGVPLKRPSVTFVPQTLTYGTNDSKNPTPIVVTSAQNSASIYEHSGYIPTVPTKIDNHIVFCVLSMIFCFLPCGIIATVYSAKVNDKIQIGDYAGAIESANKAKTWCWIAFGFGLLIFFVGVSSK